MTPLDQEARKAADKYAFGRCSRNHLGPNKSSSFFKNTEAIFLAGAAFGREQMLKAVTAGIKRELNYREYREDQDGSDIAACKEILGWLKAVEAGEMK